MSKAKAQRTAQPSSGGFLLPGHQGRVSARPAHGSLMILQFPKARVISPDEAALLHIKYAMENVIAWHHECAASSVEMNGARLREIAAAFGYGRALVRYFGERSSTHHCKQPAPQLRRKQEQDT